MKKLAFLILVISLIFVISACDPGSRRVLLTGAEDGGVYSIDTSAEYDLQNEFKEIGVKDRTHEAVINGKTYVGKYVETLISPYYECDADIYLSTDDNGIEVEFWINRKYDKLVGYMICYRNGYTIRSDSLSYDECYQIALTELGLHLNSEEYLPTMQEDNQKAVSSPECGNVYSFYFVKMLDGFRTSVIVWIDVNTDGEVCLFRAAESPSIDCNKDHSSVAEAMSDPKTRDLIDKKILSVFSAYDPDKLSWAIDKQYVSKLKNGRECIQYDILITVDGNDTPGLIRLMMLV